MILFCSFVYICCATTKPPPPPPQPLKPSPLIIDQNLCARNARITVIYNHKFAGFLLSLVPNLRARGCIRTKKKNLYKIHAVVDKCKGRCCNLVRCTKVRSHFRKSYAGRQAWLCTGTFSLKNKYVCVFLCLLYFCFCVYYFPFSPEHFLVQSPNHTIFLF